MLLSDYESCFQIVAGTLNSLQTEIRASASSLRWSSLPCCLCGGHVVSGALLHDHVTSFRFIALEMLDQTVSIYRSGESVSNCGKVLLSGLK